MTIADTRRKVAAIAERLAHRPVKRTWRGKTRCYSCNRVTCAPRCPQREKRR